MGRTTHREPEVTVALQGTLDTFALPDVLRLLAATKKTGRLRLTGSRGAGSVWVTAGEIIAVEATHAPHATEVLDALFELLRFEEGSFTFDADATHDSPGPGAAVEALLGEAEALLAEWRQIEVVVPSLDAYVTLRRSLDAPSLTIAHEQWTTLVAVGGGSTVRRIGDELCLAEIPISRAVRDLAELGVVDIAAAAPAEAAAALRPGPSPAPAPDPQEAPEDAPQDAVDEPAVADDLPEHEAPGALPAARPLRARRKTAVSDEGPAEPEHWVPLELPEHLRSSAPPAEADTGDDAPDDAAPDVDDLAAAFPGLANRGAGLPPGDPELARQLATLSPRAAEAVRAAAAAETDEERDAALDAAAADEEGPVNRGLLLKFLSSVKS
jgi:hypothetical protein